MRDEQRKVVESLKQQIVLLQKDFESARKVAEGVGITDFNSSMRDIGTLGNGLDEIDKLHDNNGYLDLRKAEIIARNVYKKGVEAYNGNVEEWIRIKNNALDKPKNGEINFGISLYVSSPISLILMVIGINEDIVWLVLLSLAIPFLSGWIYNTIKLNISGEMKKVNSDITRLQDLKKK